ncbi:uncharacterized protein LOC122391146 [Amphibalanus amphitrite]|uniref:uncharacterized protein LOC122391146 n=1 Tax=Amphibalanus amphitrite TaxID=1232801 RepID=UPI001C914A73|nr:uncharacterized protein LOC122391146 [Amphibalanus amphitrite]XP_043240756.1 uncharacterized protein LOC122391146 [Amphibalanus amphitrite]
MGRKRKTFDPAAASGLRQSALERRLCNVICLCQLLAIISGVALIYLCFIVIKPSHYTLAARFEDDASVCTTLGSTTSGACLRPSCAEWCLSSTGGTCRVITASVRRPGVTVVFRDCQLQDQFCSELSPDHLQTFVCSEGEDDGECHGLHGLFNCSEIAAKPRVGRGPHTSICKNVTALSQCTNTARWQQPENLTRCNRYVCNHLRGVFECVDGVCRQLKSPRCHARCADLTMGNIAVATADRFHWGRCRAAEVLGEPLWTADEQPPLAIFCTRLQGGAAGDLVGDDCVNGTLVPADEFGALETYRAVRAALRRHVRLLVPAEEFIFNATQVMVNIDGCVNTLRSECSGWLAERLVDGSDGRHPAVYPCHVTPSSTDYVITDYDRRQTIRQMALAATLPCAFLTLSCLCLFICGKLVRVSEYGVFYCRDCHAQSPTRDPKKSSTL